MASKIVLYNPHNELWFGVVFKFWLYRRPWVPKYRYITTNLAKENGRIYALSRIDSSASFYLKFLDSVSFILWLAINDLPILRSRLYFSTSSLSHHDLLLIIYIGNFTSFAGPVESSRLVARLNSTTCIKILNVNHFPYNISSGARALQSLSFNAFWAEVDLFTCSPYFSSFFSDHSSKPFIVVPFAVRSKFTFLGTISSMRLNTIFATGSISLDMSNDHDFVGFFKNSSLQPMRCVIYQQSENCQIHPLFHNIINKIDSRGSTRPVLTANNPIYAVANWIHNVFVYGQRAYHSIDLHAKFNLYRFHLVGEEIVGIPGISFAEGMLCGSILIGLDHPMYRSIGMIPWEHFIPYYESDTPDTIASRVLEISSDRRLINKIQSSSLSFAMSRFTEDAAWAQFSSLINDLASSPRYPCH